MINEPIIDSTIRKFSFVPKYLDNLERTSQIRKPSLLVLIDRALINSYEKIQTEIFLLEESGEKTLSIDIRTIEGRNRNPVNRGSRVRAPFCLSNERGARVRTMFTKPVILYAARRARISFDKYAGSSHSPVHL